MGRRGASVEVEEKGYRESQRRSIIRGHCHAYADDIPDHQLHLKKAKSDIAAIALLWLVLVKACWLKL